MAAKRKAKEWLKLKACADRLDLSQRQVENLVTLGLPREQRDGSWAYPFPEVFRWYLGQKEDAAKAKRESANRHAADDRLANVKAQIAELELAKATGDVVTMDYLEEQLALIVGRSRRAVATCRASGRRRSWDFATSRGPGETRSHKRRTAELAVGDR